MIFHVVIAGLDPAIHAGARRAHSGCSLHVRMDHRAEHQARQLRRSDLQRRHRLHLDQQIFAHQAVDDEKRVRRKGAAGKQPWEFARPVGGKLGDILRMHQIAGEGDDVGEARALRGERGADLREHQRALRLEIGRRLAVLADADLAGNEQKLRSFDARDIRIRRRRLGHAVGIETLDRGHGRYSQFVSGKNDE